ncbi:MAG: ABC transporter permease [Bdellovibrionia bacterium]
MKLGYTRTLKGFILKEFKQSLRDPKMRALLFVAPIVQLTLFGFAISNDIKNIRLFAAPTSTDITFRHVYDRAIASKWFIPAVADRKIEPFEMIRGGLADVVLVAPPGGLMQAMGKGQGELQVLINAVNVLQAQAIESYFRGITNSVAAHDLSLDIPTPPISFDMRVLYNPTLQTSYFMVPGVMCLLISLITIILTSTSIAREKEMGTFEMLISAPVSSLEIIFGKTVPYVILGISNLPLILGVAVFGFGVPVRGSLFLLGGSTFIYVCTTVAIGTMISTITNSQQQATLAGFLFLFPAILFSGLLFPLENMPFALKIVAAFNPLSHFLMILRNIMLKGGDLNFVLVHTGILLLMGTIMTLWSLSRFKTTLN